MSARHKSASGRPRWRGGPGNLRSIEPWLGNGIVGKLPTPDAESITVKEAATLWLTRREAQLLEKGSLRTYQGYVDHILPRLGYVKLARLYTPMIETFADTLTAELSWHRARMVLSVLKMILNNAQRRGLVKYNGALP